MAYFDFEPTTKTKKGKAFPSNDLFESMGDVFRPSHIPSVNPNSVEAFHTEETQTKRNTQKERCLHAISTLGECTQAEISESTGIARHLIPDRLIQLESAGLIEKCGNKIDKYSGMKVTLYKIKRRVN